ncbi:MAG: hypothetical protein CBC12_14090 [Candidatus Puniceispirillum sp. TMED52]|nr:hypothetical protein [SAR116 cluster bacterium]OUU43476.1 MAG: hypothetical protein CBC12_14090 [Candidatus Puniceispirillum sp. TMED52]|tara:strand:+ start:2060 stop:2398 length:339 start_codon:yes stop_codon:yes gene_type:complete
MAEGRVTISINGHNYPLACNPGEEEHIQALAAKLDKTAQQIAGGNSSINESRLLVMVGLIFADRINDLENKNGSAVSENPAATSENGQEQIVTSIESITKRIERLASQIKPD